MPLCSQLRKANGLLVPRWDWERMGPRVYFADVNSEYIKIGYSSNVMRRLQALRAHNPYPVDLVAVLHGDCTTERRLHVALADLRVGHEWFARRGELVAFLTGKAVRESYKSLNGKPRILPLSASELEAAE